MAPADVFFSWAWLLVTAATEASCLWTRSVEAASAAGMKNCASALSSTSLEAVLGTAAVSLFFASAPPKPPAAVLCNASQLSIPWLHFQLQVKASGNYAVIAPNMGKQIVAFQVRGGGVHSPIHLRAPCSARANLQALPPLRSTGPCSCKPSEADLLPLA